MAGTIVLALSGLALLVGCRPCRQADDHRGAFRAGRAVFHTGMTGSFPARCPVWKRTDHHRLWSWHGWPVIDPAHRLSFHPDASALGLLALLCTLPTDWPTCSSFARIRQAGASAGAVLILLKPLSGSVLAACC